MRLMTYNMEWFADHIEPDNSLSLTPESQAKIDALTRVIGELDPDIIGITEGPNTTTTSGELDTVSALENWASVKSMRQSKALLGFSSPGRQEIALLYDPSIITAQHEPGGNAGTIKNPTFNEQFRADSDVDGIQELFKHYRPPLEAKITRADGGVDFWLIVAHAKSKGIFSNMDRVHFERRSERDRKKLFAECGSIRQRVDEFISAGRLVVVMGDINDGPGFDYYESQFGRSAVELIMGDIFDPDRVLHNNVGRPKFGPYGWEPATARFTDRFTGDRVNALIDHILVSKEFETTGEQPSQVWHPWNHEPAKPMKDDLLAASDHFPVTLDIA